VADSSLVPGISDYALVQWVKIPLQVGAGLMAAGPLIASGHRSFLAAAGFTAGTANVATSTFRRKRFPDRFPAAFFMNIEDEG